MITVIGAGAFGTAMAIGLAKTQDVRLWARNAEHLEEMHTDRENRRRLPGFALPERLEVTSRFPTLREDDLCLLCVPMQQLRSILDTHSDELRNGVLIACCKGIEVSSGLGPVQLIRSVFPDARAGILTGPGFAQDIARGLPTAMTLALEGEEGSEAIQSALSTANVRLYLSNDTIGAEIGGALKNVLAIGCGAVMGAGLGDSARAALMTRGFAEIRRLALAEGADPETLAGLSGFGDMVLTCTSDLSRNYRYGFAIGTGEGFDRSVTVEGVPTAHAVMARAERFSVDMPVTAAIVNLINGKLSVSETVEHLFSRPLKKE